MAFKTFNMPAMPERSGKLFEYDIFGQIKKPAGIPPEAFKRFKEEYLPYEDALNFTKDFQPGDPTHPSKDFARDLRIEIMDKLNIPPRNDNAVKFYTAVESPLDRYHGIDAFIEIKIGDMPAQRITLDASLRPEKKKEGAKADFIIDEVPDPKEEEDEYLAKVEEVADEIVDFYEQKFKKAA